jgi:biotin carboxylase
MRHKRVLVVGWKRPLLQKAKALGAEVWFAQHPGKYRPDVADVSDMILLCDYTDQESFVALVADLHSVRPFDAVVAVAEDALLPTSIVVDRLGLRGASARTVRLLTDKWAMRQILAESGVDPVTAALGSTGADLLAFGAESGYPFIAKPIAGCGSFGVSEVASPEHVPGALSALGGRRFIMEEFLDGPEISVETFSFGSRHVVLAMTEKHVGNGFVEAGHTVPAELPQDLVDEVRTLVERFLDTVGLCDSPAHVEVKLTRRGPRIVEGHNRRGGDRINELVEHTCGIDMEALTLAWALDLTEPLTAGPHPVGQAAIRFLTAAPGEVLEVAGIDAATRVPGVRAVQVSVKPGDNIGPVEWSDDRPGYVVAVADHDAAEVCARAAGLIRIHTHPISGTGRSQTLPTCGVDQSPLFGY